MPVVHIPSPFKTYTNGAKEIQVDGSNVSNAIENLVIQHPSLQPYLYSPKGKLRPFINLFLNQENIKNLQHLETPLEENDHLYLILSISGGRY